MLNSQPSAFFEFYRFSEWLFENENRRHGIALSRLFERVFEYLTDERGEDKAEIATILWSDYTRAGRRDRPAFLRPYELPEPPARSAVERTVPERQSRHQ